MSKQRFAILVLLIGLATVSTLGIVCISSASPPVSAVGHVAGSGSFTHGNYLPNQSAGFSDDNYYVGEAEGSATITVTLDAAPTLTVTVDYATSDVTAAAGSDYLAASGVLTFAPGITIQTFTVAILDDTVNEADETVALTLSNPTGGALITSASAILTIVDDEHGIFLPVILRRWPPIPDTPVLNPISNPDGDGNYTVDWDVAQLADGYVLEEATNAAFSDAQVIYQGPGTSYPVSGQPGGTYYYRVKATNSWGDSNWSNTQAIIIGPPDAPVLNPIYNLDGDGNYTVSWIGVSGATSYILEEDDNAAFTSPGTRYAGPGTSWTASDMSAGTYYYRVKSRNAVGDSAWSNVRSVTVVPSADYFYGSSPPVSFNLTSDHKVCGFYIKVPFADTSCILRADSDVCFDAASGHFRIDIYYEELGILDWIDGDFNSSWTSATGNYRISLCGSTFLLTPSTGTWTATKQ